MCYLMAHPDASDSVRGIAQWWLPYEADQAAVSAALDALRSRGWLSLTHGRFFGLNPTARGEILCWLDAHQSDELRG